MNKCTKGLFNGTEILCTTEEDVYSTDFESPIEKFSVSPQFTFSDLDLDPGTVRYYIHKRKSGREKSEKL